MKEIDQEYKHAISIGMVTLLGVGGKPPFKIGNCFSVNLQEGGWAQIVNFNHENLNHLLSNEIISYPIKVVLIGPKHAVFCDSRIPEEFYSEEFCTVCTPKNLLPMPQRIKQLIQIQSGIRKEFDNGITMNYIKDLK